jgi:hypothetical protein
MQALDNYDIHSTGRFGGWKYSSMQEAVLDGKKAAKKTTIVDQSKSPLLALQS